LRRGESEFRILVSNDDGIDSEGILALARALERIAEVWVVAPDREQSACSHSLTMGRPLRRKRLKTLGPRYFSVNGTPTDCVLIGVSKVLPERPHLIVSGINKGENLGEDITYSGTVSAAVEGVILGIPSFAISLTARKDFDFGPAARFAVRLARNILTQGLPRNTFLNVNVPARAKAGSYKITRMGKRVYGESVKELSNGWGRKYYTIGGNDPGYADTEDSDFKAIAENVISITPLHLDWTNYASIETLLKRKI
jgi:5'-nucleotidase